MLELAELFVTQRQLDEATALLDEVQAICEPLGAKPTLERVSDVRTRIEQMSRRAPSYPAGLSPREVEVLWLVAEGLTDAKIAGDSSSSAGAPSRRIFTSSTTRSASARGQRRPCGPRTKASSDQRDSGER